MAAGKSLPITHALGFHWALPVASIFQGNWLINSPTTAAQRSRNMSKLTTRACLSRPKNNLILCSTKPSRMVWKRVTSPNQKVRRLAITGSPETHAFDHVALSACSNHSSLLTRILPGPSGPVKLAKKDSKPPAKAAAAKVCHPKSACHS